MDNNDNERFPYLIVMFLLSVVWLLTNFTTFLCILIIVLVLKIANTTDSNNTKRTRQNNNHPAVQVCQECLCRSTEPNVSRESLSLPTGHCQLLIDQGESENTQNNVPIEQNSDNQRNIVLSSETEQDTTGEVPDDQAAPRSPLGPLLDATQDDIYRSIAHTPPGTETAAFNFRYHDGVPTGRATPTSMSDTTDGSEESATRPSPFVTENVMKIAISYSSEHRERVLDITRILKPRVTTDECPHPVFLDSEFQHEICRLNGTNYLQKIYGQARLVVVFLSPRYPESGFCRGEWRAILDRFLNCGNQDRQDEQLLLVKLGEYDMKALNLTADDFPVDRLILDNEKVAELIAQRSNLVEQLLGTNRNNNNI